MLQIKSQNITDLQTNFTKITLRLLVLDDKAAV